MTRIIRPKTGNRGATFTWTEKTSKGVVNP